MNPLTLHHAKTQSEDDLEELHSQDPIPTDAHGEAEVLDQTEQTSTSTGC
jgi:hypothetical protein